MFGKLSWSAIPFDQPIPLLTGAVVTTETAAIAAKRKNAQKVGDTVVNGFFSYVKSEISQQISEITQSEIKAWLRGSPRPAH